jgi:hypothetical protein
MSFIAHLNTRSSRLAAFATVGLSGLILAGCSLPFGQKTDPTAPQNKLDTAANAAKLSVMMASGKSGSCLITDTSKADAGAMEIAIKGKKFRMKTSGAAMGAPETSPAVTPTAKKSSYILKDEEYTYIWEEGATTGFKMKAATDLPTPDPKAGQGMQKPVGSGNATNPADSLDTFEADEKYRVDCTLEEVADSVVTPPKEVTFMEFGQNLPGKGMMPGQAIPSYSLPANDAETGE